MAAARANVVGGLLAVVCTGGCLLFTDDVNEPPQVTEIEPAGGTVFRGPQSFTAHVTDDQDDSFELTWSWAPACGDGPARDQMRATVYALKVTAMSSVCIRVTAKDRHGAEGSKEQLFSVANRSPEAKLQLETSEKTTWPSGKVRLYAEVKLSAERSRDPDGDPLSFSFKLTRPDGSTAAPPACATAQDARRCFVPDKPGHYEAVVTVSDRTDMAAPASLAFDVDDDHPPCLISSDPLPFQPVVFVPHDGKRVFEVRQVEDDGEPYPPLPGRAEESLFVWSKAADREPLVRIAGNNAPTLQVSEGLFEAPRPGDQFRVRVEVRDRLIEERLQQRLLRPPCGEETDVCEVEGCLRWTTWKVQFFP